MYQNDTLKRFLFENLSIRGEWISLDESFQTILSHHDYPPPIRRLLGETLVIAGLLSALIKFEGRLTVQFRGKEGLKLLLAQCNEKLQLRGIVKWDGAPTYEELMSHVEGGTLAITLDSRQNNSRYQGIVAWKGSSLAESIEAYFKASEQLATKIVLAVNETRATGLLLQVMPTDINIASQEAEWLRISKSLSLLSVDGWIEEEAENILTQLYPEDEIRVFSPEPVAFYCQCSRTRSEDAILLLGKEEAQAELEEKQMIVVTCDFCNKEYLFDRMQVETIFEKNQKPPSDIYLN